MYDRWQHCCEHRYLHTDDDLDFYKGSLFLGAEVRTGAVEKLGGCNVAGDVLESEFLILRTTKGEFTVVCYNEHNGYYGGIEIGTDLSESDGGAPRNPPILLSGLNPADCWGYNESYRISYPAVRFSVPC